MYFCLLHFVIDFLVILLDAPAFIWYGWLKVLNVDGHCGDNTKYGIWAQLWLGILFYLALRTLKTLVLTPLRAFENAYKKKNGLSEQTWCQFACFSVIIYFE